MHKSGQITVFLSLVFLCIFSLMCGLIESARTAGARFYLKLAADSAMDSVFSRYHKEVWDQYRLFLLEEDEGELEVLWKESMKPYMESSGWYSLGIESAHTGQCFQITNDDGKYLKQEIIDYMKYGVFKDMPDEENATGMLKSLGEAKLVGNLSEAYNTHAREAVSLENKLEDIYECLENQKKLWQEADAEIGDYNGLKFRKYILKMEKEMDQIPSLVASYGKIADQLKSNLEKTDKGLLKRQDELTTEVKEGINQETLCYDSYINQDGERRKAIEALPEKMEQMRPVIEQAKERSYEVEEIIDSWDSDDEEDDGPDVDELWDSVGEIWNRVNVVTFSYLTGVKDPQKQKILEQVKEFTQDGLMSLVLPEGKKISEGIIQSDTLPSASYSPTESQTSTLMDRVILGEYSSRFLTSFLSEDEKDVLYEMEYIISGEETDEDNLEQTVTEILLIREGLNLIHILTDSQKREEAQALAGVITGSTGLLPLTGIIAFFIMSIWALAEAVSDVKMLLEGKKTALIKTRETWNMTLDQVLTFGKKGSCETGQGDPNGVNYMGYLKLLLFIGHTSKQYYRLMDVIQMNICTEQKGFRMENCIYQAEMEGIVQSKHMFFGGITPKYSMEVKTEKAY